jgi:hypothetical protein
MNFLVPVHIAKSTLHDVPPLRGDAIVTSGFSQRLKRALLTREISNFMMRLRVRIMRIVRSKVIALCKR